MKHPVIVNNRDTREVLETSHEREDKDLAVVIKELIWVLRIEKCYCCGGLLQKSKLATTSSPPSSSYAYKIYNPGISRMSNLKYNRLLTKEKK